MTLRDIGTWLGSIWDRILVDLDVVLSSSPLDWPLWIFPAGAVLVFIILPILVFSILPIVVGTILREARNYIQNEPPMGIGWCIGFTICAVLCATVLVDLYVPKTIFDETRPSPKFLYIGYPIMTVFFGFAAFVEWRKQLRTWRRRR